MCCPDCEDHANDNLHLYCSRVAGSNDEAQVYLVLHCLFATCFSVFQHNLRPSHGYVEIDESQLDPDFQSKRNSEPTNLYVPRQDQTR